MVQSFFTAAMGAETQMHVSTKQREVEHILNKEDREHLNILNIYEVHHCQYVKDEKVTIMLYLYFTIFDTEMKDFWKISTINLLHWRF